MAGRKRKATTPQANNESRPTKRAPRKSAGTTKAAADPEQKEEDTVAPPTIDFADLPSHFMVEVMKKMTYTEMASFRLTCKKALEVVEEEKRGGMKVQRSLGKAVDHWGRSQRALDIVRLVGNLWPEKKDDPFRFDSLMGVEKEMEIFSNWLDFELIDSIDFAGFATLNPSQLETVFGNAPRGNVKKLNLVGIIVMPDVWTTLSRLFPGVRNVRCSEDAANFPEEIIRAIELAPQQKLPPHTLVEQRALVESGHLDKERVFTLRCLKRLFPAARYMYVD